MARLKMDEKYKIQQGLIEGKTVEELATTLGRSVSAITKYKSEFQEMANKFANTEPQADNEVEELQEQVSQLKDELNNTESSNKIILLEAVVIETLHKLRVNGVQKDDAKMALNIVEGKLTERIDDAAQLAGWCMQQLSVHNSMITQGEGGREGVAIMTQTASQIIDEKKKYASSNLRSARDCLFNPKTGEVS